CSTASPVKGDAVYPVGRSSIVGHAEPSLALGNPGLQCPPMGIPLCICVPIDVVALYLLFPRVEISRCSAGGDCELPGAGVRDPFCSGFCRRSRTWSSGSGYSGGAG